VRLNTQVAPVIQGLEWSLAHDQAYHLYELRFDPGLQAAELWVDGHKRLDGYRGHTQYQEDGDFLFGTTAYRSSRGVGASNAYGSRSAHSGPSGPPHSSLRRPSGPAMSRFVRRLRIHMRRVGHESALILREGLFMRITFSGVLAATAEAVAGPPWRPLPLASLRRNPPP